MKRYVLFLTLLISASRVHAATIYLDGGIAQTSCTNYLVATRACGAGTDTAYKLPYEASQALKAGDRLYIRQGAYYEDIRTKTGYGWTLGTLSIGASNTWIENYMGEEVWIQSGPEHTAIGVDDTNNALSIGGSGNTINGIGYNLKMWGGTILSGTDNTIQGCDLSGGWDHEAPFGIKDGAFANVVRIFFAVRATLRNCKLHDNQWCADGVNNNKALLMHTEDQDTIIENCHFYNPLASLMYVKHQSASGIVEMTYRYNLFDGGAAFDYPGLFKNKYIYVYQNIFRNTKVGNSRQGMVGNYLYVYNNVYYNVEKVLYDWKASSLANWVSFFNNIVYCDTFQTANVYYDAATDFMVMSDYNVYFRSGVNYTWRNGSSPIQTSISGWKSLSGLDSHSSDQNPGFLNTSGSFSQPSDFKRSSYPQTGIGGQYPSVIGAYVTGNETIGLTGKVVYPPKNLRAH